VTFPAGPEGLEAAGAGVDIDHDFAPTYEIDDDKKKKVTELRKLAKDASDIWFATDLDREGEAIAWHLTQVLEVDPRRPSG
jgi:DNA topoisomerase I